MPEDLSLRGPRSRVYLADGGVGRDGIPALTDPVFVPIEDQAATTYLSSDARVIGVFLDGEWLAIPHNIMYRHEIVNLTRGSEQVAVTYCPLTGSALAFDRASVDGAEFGVSGLLFQANLIMYDRNADDSLWPQMRGAAACGSRMGQALTRHPVLEMTWGGWQDLFTGSTVVGVEPLDADGYSVNPYGEHIREPGQPELPRIPDSARRHPASTEGAGSGVAGLRRRRRNRVSIPRDGGPRPGLGSRIRLCGDPGGGAVGREPVCGRRGASGGR